MSYSENRKEKKGHRMREYREKLKTSDNTNTYRLIRESFVQCDLEHVRNRNSSGV